MDATVAVATFGERKWVRLAQERAIPSAQGQAEVIHTHGTSLAHARNKALEQITTPWVIYLDADDELSPNYVYEMAAGHADIRVPAVQYIRNGKARPSQVPRVVGHHHRHCVGACLQDGNYIAIGACCDADLMRRAGGWGTEPMWEDWSLFLRMWTFGADVETLPRAVYRAHVQENGRNQADQAFKDRLYANIRSELLGSAA